ncbi:MULTISPECIES: D-2-hydroxyacid dehydrogenase [Marinovum]|jgi:phosphoglycerate dehydrogenase-like enzyme|uniref:D-2-hydroxyacid dehydrogenase n=1 Tax=Marinovum TaxID=367771 RepID=UPI00237BDA94|nr:MULTISPECIES: D-2-hydroxyacid dehydrogenase [Marinovum]MDD9739731.1 D-2-hydroxyacid dehydrogenase [Marinovum sp. SP66]
MISKDCAGLETAEVAILQNLLPADELHGPNLRWVHLTHAGIDRVARPAVLERGLRVSGSAGYSVETLAEHALFFMLSLAYRAADLLDAQRRASWEKAGRERLRSLYGHTVGIVGLGHIGQALAKRCAAMGMRVIGYRRSASAPVPHVDHVYSAQDENALDALLAASDYVVLALPLTNASRNLMNARTLGLMKRSAYLINIARGDVVDEPALIAALKDGQIAGAGLDVFCQEPLPSDSPFWTLKNVLITPHTSPQEPNRDKRAVDLIRENVSRYRTGQVLINEMTRADLFTP